MEPGRTHSRVRNSATLCPIPDVTPSPSPATTAIGAARGIPSSHRWRRRAAQALSRLHRHAHRPQRSHTQALRRRAPRTGCVSSGCGLRTPSARTALQQQGQQSTKLRQTCERLRIGVRLRGSDCLLRSRFTGIGVNGGRSPTLQCLSPEPSAPQRVRPEGRILAGAPCAGVV